MAKKLKKILKNLAKVGTLGALAYGATKLGGKKSKTAKNVLTGRDLNLRGKLASAMPDHLTPDTGSGRDSSRYYHPEIWTGAKAGGRIGAKGGGLAKRGMGAAFKKGGHVKSMGIAKRGGGAAKR